MTYKKLLLLSLFFGLQTLAQTVTIADVTVNNYPISNNTINLGSNSISNISLSVDITVGTSPNDNYPPIIQIKYKKTSSSTPVVANGGFPRTLLFLGGTWATTSFNLELNSAQFNASGGTLYAEYTNYSGITTLSNSISIIKNTNPDNGGTNPSGPGPDVFTQYVPYGGTIILPNPSDTDGPYADILEKSFFWGYGPYQMMPTIAYDPTRPLYAPIYAIYETSKTTYMNGQITYGINSIDINGEFQRKAPLKVSQRPFPNVRSCSIQNNLSGGDQYPFLGSVPQTIVGDDALARIIPYENTEPGYVYVPMPNYQWQKRLKKPAPKGFLEYHTYATATPWVDIPGATSKDYTPSNLTNTYEYRRLVIEDPSAPAYNKREAASNVVTVYYLPLDFSIDNTICCDQEVTSSGQLQTIIGSTPVGGISNFYSYWQKGTIRDGELNWSDIRNYSGKDYTPSWQPGRIGVSLTTYYRRVLVRKSDNTYFISNAITITQLNASKMANISPLNDKGFDQNFQELIAYPNPATTKLMINQKAKQIIAVDVVGKRIILKNLGTDDQFDVSDLAPGLYSLWIETKNGTICRKMIKE